MSKALSAIIAMLTLASSPAFHARQGSPIEPLHFHHVHLNSMDPKLAAEYYLKPFALSVPMIIQSVTVMSKT